MDASSSLSAWENISASWKFTLSRFPFSTKVGVPPTIASSPSAMSAVMAAS